MVPRARAGWGVEGWFAFLVTSHGGEISVVCESGTAALYTCCFSHTAQCREPLDGTTQSTANQTPSVDTKNQEILTDKLLAVALFFFVAYLTWHINWGNLRNSRQLSENGLAILLPAYSSFSRAVGLHIIGNLQPVNLANWYNPLHREKTVAPDERRLGILEAGGMPSN